MQIIIDEREPDLYEKCLPLTFENTHVRISKQVLPLGDIYIKNEDDQDVCIIERKSLRDLLASIKDGRYEEQSHRLLNASGFSPHNIIYIIEGIISQLDIKDKKLVYSSITSLNYYKGFSVLNTSSVQETAELIIYMADKIKRNTLKGVFPIKPIILSPPLQLNQEPNEIDNNTHKNYCNFVKKVKKDNITPENIGEILLCQIPGISSVSAITIMKKFPSFLVLLQEIKINPNCLDDITIETNGKHRKISKAIIENIKKYLITGEVVNGV